MKRTTKNLLIGSGIAIAGLAAIGVLHRASAKALMKVALDREEPKGMEKEKNRIAGSSEYSEMISNALNAAGALESRNLETVEIISHDGIRLVGHWYCPENPKRAIVAMHGWRSSWTNDFGPIADFWFESDCCVLFAEQRGQGESEGDYMGFGLLERYDCLEWIKWTNERTDSSIPIYLGGVSMGASTVLMTTGFDLPESVHGVIADCGFTTPQAIWKHVVEDNLHIPYGLYSSAAREMCRKKIQVESDSYSCTEALKNCKVPVMFIHGTDDHFVPVEMTYENYKACSAPKRLFIVPGAEHGMSYLIDKEGYENAVIKFWQEFD